MSDNSAAVQNISFISFDTPTNDHECFLKYHNSSGIPDSGKNILRWFLESYFE